MQHERHGSVVHHVARSVLHLVHPRYCRPTLSIASRRRRAPGGNKAVHTHAMPRTSPRLTSHRNMSDTHDSARSQALASPASRRLASRPVTHHRPASFVDRRITYVPKQHNTSRTRHTPRHLQTPGHGSSPRRCSHSLALAYTRWAVLDGIDCEREQSTRSMGGGSGGRARCQ